MDFHALQKKLFSIDPTDPRDDLRKLQAAAQGRAAVAETTIDYVAESAKVKEGSLKMDKDYSVSDFAALAGVQLSERQKTGSEGQLKGKDSITKQPAGTTKNPTRNKLVGEEDEDRIAHLEARITKLESVIIEMAKAKKPVAPIQRNPVAAFAQRSGAGSHKDQDKRSTPLRKEKHKKKDYAIESIKDELYRLLDSKK